MAEDFIVPDPDGHLHPAKTGASVKNPFSTVDSLTNSPLR